MLICRCDLELISLIILASFQIRNVIIDALWRESELVQNYRLTAVFVSVFVLLCCRSVNFSTTVVDSAL